MIATFLRTPRSPRTIVVWLALWLRIVGNLALWRELWQVGSGGDTFTIIAPSTFLIVFSATLALLALTAWGRPMKPLWIAIPVAAG
ncbi:MAG: phosphoethanolamine transferase, partial [Pseudomonadota bacterium]|nr:phosphoethanolamine transferase [Pseudomonadota bacterium]